MLFTYVAANDRAVFVFQTNFLFQELFIKAYSSLDAKPSNHFSAQTREDVLDEISFAVERVSVYSVCIGIINIFHNISSTTSFPV